MSTMSREDVRWDLVRGQFGWLEGFTRCWMISSLDPQSRTVEILARLVHFGLALLSRVTSVMQARYLRCYWDLLCHNSSLILELRWPLKNRLSKRSSTIHLTPILQLWTRCTACCISLFSWDFRTCFHCYLCESDGLNRLNVDGTEECSNSMKPLNLSPYSPWIPSSSSSSSFNSIPLDHRGASEYS